MKKAVVFFDEKCVFCNYWVKHIINFDRDKFYYFSPVNSDYYNDIFKDNLKIINSLDSIILYENSSIKIKSSAVISILKKLTIFHKLLAGILSVFPKYIADLFYDFFSKRRNKFCKTSSSCDYKLISERILK